MNSCAKKAINGLFSIRQKREKINMHKHTSYFTRAHIIFPSDDEINSDWPDIIVYIKWYQMKIYHRHSHSRTAQWWAQWCSMKNSCKCDRNHCVCETWWPENLFKSPYLVAAHPFALRECVCAATTISTLSCWMFFSFLRELGVCFFCRKSKQGKSINKIGRLSLSSLCLLDIHFYTFDFCCCCRS